MELSFSRDNFILGLRLYCFKFLIVSLGKMLGRGFESLCQHTMFLEVGLVVSW